MMEQVRVLTRKAVSEFGETARFLGGVAAVWLVLVTFGFAAFHIPSESMQPALQVGDRVLVSKFTYGYSRHSLPLGLGYALPNSWNGRVLGSTPQRGDVIVVRDPVQKINIIKRVIGLPGDSVEVRGGRMVLNGELVHREPQGQVRYRDRSGILVQASVYIEEMPGTDGYLIYERSDTHPMDNIGPFQVPANHIFLMGDNRDASADSRGPNGLGYVHTDHVVGQAFTVLFTFASCREEEGLHCPPWRVWRGL